MLFLLMSPVISKSNFLTLVLVAEWLGQWPFLMKGGPQV